MEGGVSDDIKDSLELCMKQVAEWPHCPTKVKTLEMILRAIEELASIRRAQGSREVARLFDVEHQNLRETIEAHRDSLERLGVFRFETDKPLTSLAGGRPEKFCYLNSDQIGFLLTVTRTTEQTKELRLRLIIAFRDARLKLRPIDHALLTIPAPWRKTFPDSFYKALLPLYGNPFDPSGDKPGWVGTWTNRFVYDPLASCLPEELKAKRFGHSGHSAGRARRSNTPARPNREGCAPRCARKWRTH